jgi:hypothetical protein
MLERHSDACKNVVLEYEPWKSNVGRPIQSANTSKFYTMFTKEEREMILARLAELGGDQLNGAMRSDVMRP